MIAGELTLWVPAYLKLSSATPGEKESEATIDNANRTMKHIVMFFRQLSITVVRLVFL
jgi:hypothetical protein